MSEITGHGAEKPGSSLREVLRVTFDPKYSTLGHGTWVETAKASLKTGVQAKMNHLGTTAIPLFDMTISYGEQIDGVIQTLSEWPHHHLPAVSIIMLPNPDENEAGGHRYFDSYFEELSGKDTEHNNRYVIPAAYVRGYLDVNQKVFVENPDFNPVKKSPPQLEPTRLPIRRFTSSPHKTPQSGQDASQKIEDDIW